MDRAGRHLLCSLDCVVPVCKVLCDLGTDCSDCGGWSFEGIGPDETAPRPIKMLLDLEVTVNLAHTSTVPSFLMPYTDPAHDVDVSGQMAAMQNVEIGLTQVRTVSVTHCSHGAG